ncbi:ferredoxin--NADP reductase [Buchnera aphidicola (Ceratoglyphina bambusae)]|uniref:ferredoxin--NADP reductase n=1 Tax=Buchnera aphidicola TaxID=9 RepID=UPI0031B8409B
MTTWIKAKVIKIKKWNFPLFSITLHANILPFIAGQFAKIGVIHNGKKIQRAYSYVNSPKEKNLEFYITYVKNGLITKMLYKLNVNDEIMISKESFGFFTLKEIPKRKNLLMISTGTAIGPYLSILQDGSDTKKFKKIILIHAVRYKNQFNYKNIIKKIKKKYKNKFKFQRITSRKIYKKCLFGRITTLLNNDKIEKSIGIKINSKNFHVMLCGNPNMLKDTYKILKNKYNLEKHLRKKPGNITMENYW